MIDLQRRSSTGRVFLAALVLISATSCQTTTSLSDVTKLQAAIVKEYGEPGIHVNLHNNIALTVTFINSPLNTKNPEDRRKRAEATMAFVKRHYASAEKIQETWVSFVRQQSSFIVITHTEGLDYYGFDKNGQPIRMRDDEALRLTEDSLQVRTRYLPKTDETEILITTLQLEGNMSQGVAVVPHFTVPGDATGLKRSAQLPKSVSFDFASYSPKSLFRGLTQIRFMADEKVVLETSGEFSSTRGPDGIYSEFLMLQVPYTAFRLMTSGKRLAFMLDEQRYELTGEQLQALREMMKHVRD